MGAHRKFVVIQEPEAPSLKEVNEAGVANKGVNIRVSRGVAEEVPQHARVDREVTGVCQAAQDE